MQSFTSKYLTCAGLIESLMDNQLVIRLFYTIRYHDALTFFDRLGYIEAE
ncbi:MAG TPA: hypothetical protein VKM36_03735 [Balneolaceae bacterium]|nr:hypothetical protein [Balneolaceae bacterium]